MKTTVTFDYFKQMFDSIRPNNFTYHGLLALFDYLENLEIDIDEKIELDVIALCCDYTEYENMQELKKDYPNINGTFEDHITVIPVSKDGVIIQDF